MRASAVALLVALSGAARAPLPAQQPATPLDGVAMVREMTVDPVASDGPSMVMRYDSYVLFRGGISMRGIPAGAPSGWDAEALARAYPQYAGRWSESGGALHIVTTRGDERVFKDWFRLTPGQPNEMLDGKWMLSGSIMQLSNGGRSSSASAVRQLVLHGDGRFEGALSGGASTGGVVTARQRASSGRYHIDGYEIEFQYDDGTTVRQLYCYSSAEHATLLIGGARLIKRK